MGCTDKIELSTSSLTSVEKPDPPTRCMQVLLISPGNSSTLAATQHPRLSIPPTGSFPAVPGSWHSQHTRTLLGAVQPSQLFFYENTANVCMSPGMILLPHPPTAVFSQQIPCTSSWTHQLSVPVTVMQPDGRGGSSSPTGCCRGL